MYLNSACFEQGLIVPVHELMHTLGFVHEHNRIQVLAMSCYIQPKFLSQNLLESLDKKGVIFSPKSRKPYIKRRQTPDGIHGYKAAISTSAVAGLDFFLAYFWVDNLFCPCLVNILVRDFSTKISY